MESFARKLPHGRAVSGFTLIELMVAVAVVGILVSMAVVSYGSSVTKTRRAAAKGCLTEGAQYMERYYTLHFSYNDATTAPVLPACSADVTDFYTVAFATGTPTATAYTIQATPQGGQAADDTLCGTLSINQIGTKGATNVEACW